MRRKRYNSHSTQEKEEDEAMKDTYTAMIKQSGLWWLGWMAGIPGVNYQEPTWEALLETFKMALAEALEIDRIYASDGSRP